jgi:hypothetical protein
LKTGTIRSLEISASIPVTSTKTTSKSTKDQKGIDSTVSESKPKYEVSVETSKDDGKLKVKITADKMKDSTISAIRDKIEKIKTNDNLSIDTSKGSTGIAIGALVSAILNILEPGENPFGNIATTNISESLDDSAPLPIFIPNNSDGEVIVSVKVG